MSTALTVVLVVAITWIAIFVAIFVFMPAHARELVRFVPDCLRLVTRIAKDPQTSRTTRLMLAACAAYIAFPIDLVPDFIPVIGHLDDVAVVAIALRLVIRQSGAERVRELWPGSEAGLRAVLRLA